MLTLPERSSCPACGSTKIFDFYRFDQIPVHVGFLWESRHAALRAPTGDIVLSFCESCSFIWNRAFDPAKMSYGPGYEVSLHHSPLYQDFLTQQVARLVAQYQLKHKNVMEIGCGTGHFLELLCHVGQSEGIGIDPCAPATYQGPEQLRFLQEAYSTHHADLPTDLIAIRQVFHVISKPRDLLQTLRRNIGLAQRPVIYVEVPNGQYVIERVQLWMVFYEQVVYYTPAALAGLFSRCGFEVLDVSPCFVNDQYLSLEAMPVAEGSTAYSGDVARLDRRQLSRFSNRSESHISGLKDQLDGLVAQGKKVVSWGSAGRGITFLNAAQTQDKIHYVVDINPDRQGLFIPGTGQEVIGPGALQQVNPDVIILTNMTYATEIKEQVKSLGLTPAFLSIEYEEDQP